VTLCVESWPVRLRFFSCAPTVSALEAALSLHEVVVTVWPHAAQRVALLITLRSDVLVVDVGADAVWRRVARHPHRVRRIRSGSDRLRSDLAHTRDLVLRSLGACLLVHPCHVPVHVMVLEVAVARADAGRGWWMGVARGLAQVNLWKRGRPKSWRHAVGELSSPGRRADANGGRRLSVRPVVPELRRRLHIIRCALFVGNQGASNLLYSIVVLRIGRLGVRFQGALSEVSAGCVDFAPRACTLALHVTGHMVVARPELLLHARHERLAGALVVVGVVVW